VDFIQTLYLSQLNQNPDSKCYPAPEVKALLRIRKISYIIAASFLLTTNDPSEAASDAPVLGNDSKHVRKAQASSRTSIGFAGIRLKTIIPL
jgi:hypothetical protein